MGMETEAGEWVKVLATQEVEESTGDEAGATGRGAKATGVSGTGEGVTGLRTGSGSDEGEIGGRDETEPGVTE